LDPDFNQQDIPPSFTALFVPPGRIKPTASRQHITERYSLCEDLAQMLTETAQDHLHALHIRPQQVLQRIHQGLQVEGSPVSPEEAQWVLTRLAELLDWPLTGDG
jgi:hypothetical protein